MCIPQETRISLCINVSPNGACVWAKAHKGFLGKYYILYSKFQWLLCSPPAGGWRQPSVHTGFIAWNLLAPGVTFIWLYLRACLQPQRCRELSVMPRGWHFFGSFLSAHGSMESLGKLQHFSTSCTMALPLGKQYHLIARGEHQCHCLSPFLQLTLEGRSSIEWKEVPHLRDKQRIPLETGSSRDEPDWSLQHPRAAAYK